MFANRSGWLHRHLDNVEAVTQKSRLFKKYGMVAFIPFMSGTGVGLYGCVMIAWLLRWRGGLCHLYDSYRMDAGGTHRPAGINGYPGILSIDK